jgi:DNA-binding MarR family transcriptional regulator
MPANDLGRMLLEAQRVLAAELVEELDLRGHPGMRAGHTAVFLHIDRRSGTRLTELAARARITKQGMMLIVDDLEARGFLRRVADPEDARAKVVRLTAKGRTLAAEVRRAVQAVDGRTRRALGDRRYDTFVGVLDELVAGDEDEEAV